MLHIRNITRPDIAEHPLKSQRYFRTLPNESNGLYGRVCAWCALWSIQSYPGRQRIMLSIVGSRVSATALRMWHRADRKLPEWAAVVFAEHIRARCEVGLRLAADLEEHAAELRGVPHHLSRAGRMAAVRATRRPGTMGARARQLPRVAISPSDDGEESGGGCQENTAGDNEVDAHIVRHSGDNESQRGESPHGVEHCSDEMDHSTHEW